MHKYYAATEDEIKQEKENFFLAKLHVKNILKNHGEVVLNEKGLNLRGYKFIKYSEIKSYDILNDKNISSWKFINQYRFPFVKSSKPIIITLKDDSRIYMYIDRSFTTGLSYNEKFI